MFVKSEINNTWQEINFKKLFMQIEKKLLHNFSLQPYSELFLNLEKIFTIYQWSQNPHGVYLLVVDGYKPS